MNILYNSMIHNRKKIFVFSFGAIFYTIFLLYIWTLMSDSFSQLLDLFPKQIKTIAGFGDDLSTAGFLNGEFMHLIGPLIIGAFAITIGSTVLSSEEENKTIDQFLSLSISRSRYFTEKYFSLVLSILFLSLIFSITLKICDLIYDINLNLSSILYSGLALFIYGLTVGSITYLSGSIFAKTSQAAGVGAAVAIIGYIFDSVYKTVSSMNFLKYISLHYYYNDNKVILNGFDTFHLIILLIIILASFFIGIYIFNKRDIKT